ncbi:MAG: GntR family transcriptional regulator [Anaerolineales bacterium]|jgi:GntR family transcriptional regulator
MSRKKNARGERKPLYQQTAEKLAALLDKLDAGDRLPSEPSLADQMGVSRATLREAMRIFENQGRIIRRQGLGTYVSQPIHVIDTGLEALESIETLAARIGLDVKMSDLGLFEREATAEESERFGLDAADRLLEIERVILAKGRPVAYLVDILPREMLPFEPDDKRFKGSILDMFLRNGKPLLGYSRTDISAVSATAEIARYLKIQRGDVLMKMESWIYTKEGQVVDHTYSYFLPGTFRFHVLRRIKAA